VERFYIETWGCQMNELDSQRMAGQLMQQGLVPTRELQQADLILLNSCSVREKAAQKSYSRLGEYRLLKRERTNLRIGFCGCVAQQEGEEALRRNPDLDFVVGTGRVGELESVLRRSRRGERVLAVGFPEERPYDFEAISRDSAHKGMVTIIEGCNKRCTFCVVPSTRGPERCRPMAEILSEIEHLVEYGFVEVELLGQTVNHWREPPPPLGSGRDLDFADLLNAAAVLPGLKRLRFVTSYPRDFTDPMIAAVATHRNISPYLHLPVQSGSNRVLRRMGRGYTVEEYLGLVGRLRAARKGLALSTDLIVGFPGETEDDFLRTLALVKEVRFASVFAFKYSPRPQTAAIRLPAEDEVPKEVADERLQRVLAAQTVIQRELNEELVGREFDILVTGWSRRPGYQAGRTDCHRIVHFPVPREAVTTGTLTRVRTLRAYDHSLLGEVISSGGR
jgi:tRNA-2-methylthio-N6-dimethylallyladenosine synthase